MSKHLRRRHFVDRAVQGRMLGLFVRCWATTLLTVGGLTLAGWIFITPGVSGFVGPNSFMVTILPMALVGLCASVLVLPFMLWNMVRASHRFAGPLVRFKRHLREAADGGPLTTLHFRDGDDWPDLAEAYNDLLARFQRELKAAESEPREACDTSDDLLDSELVEQEAEVATPVGV